MEKVSIIKCFADLSDPGILKKTEHKLIDIIVIAICAVICGADKWTQIEEHGQTNHKWFYIDFYNNKRWHQSLNYKRPAEIYFSKQNKELPVDMCTSPSEQPSPSGRVDKLMNKTNTKVLFTTYPHSWLLAHIPTGTTIIIFLLFFNFNNRLLS